MKAKECLLKSINKRMIPTSYYYKESIKILSKIPSMIDEMALGDWLIQAKIIISWKTFDVIKCELEGSYEKRQRIILKKSFGI